jgi:hypothetical protein
MRLINTLEQPGFDAACENALHPHSDDRITAVCVVLGVIR